MIATVNGVAFLMRAAAPGDVPFILGTWVNSATEHVRHRRDRAKDRERSRAIEAIDTCPTVVACSPARPEKIHGWACGSGSLLLYAYVPHALRRDQAPPGGLGRAVIEACLRGYPEHIRVARRWPWASSRYVLETERAA